MINTLRRTFAFLSLLAGLTLVCPAGASAQSPGPRLALVIGEAQYRDGALATPANDAGLIAETLRAAGFDVTGAADLDQEAMRRAFQDFLSRAQQAGPDAVVFVYLAGRGVQFAGENYFAPVEATIARDALVPVEALRISDFTRALGTLPLKARIVVLDAARANPFARSGAPLAGGLALVDAEPGSLYAFNAAPGTIAPDEKGPYGVYAQGLAEMLREGGLPIDEVFARTRLRVNDVTRGGLVPWDVSKIDSPVVFFARAPNAPPVASNDPAFSNRPVRDFPPQEAYVVAVERDTFPAYQEFLAAYPNDPLAPRVRALLAARREALTWRRSVSANTPPAYWTYMRRYPHGPHISDARRRLAVISAALEPPPRFDVYDYEGLPPPPEAEYYVVDRPTIIFDAPDYPPPPVPPDTYLPRRPEEFVHLPPPPQRDPGFLPIPVPIPLPFARPEGRPGNVVQPNFGQQGPIGQDQQGGRQPGARPGGPLPGEQRPGQPGAPRPGESGVPQQAEPRGEPRPGQPGAPLPRPGEGGLPQQAEPRSEPRPGQPGAPLPRPGEAGVPQQAEPRGEPRPGQPGAPLPRPGEPAVAPQTEPRGAPRPGQPGGPSARPGEPAQAVPPGQPKLGTPASPPATGSGAPAAQSVPPARGGPGVPPGAAPHRQETSPPAKTQATPQSKPMPGAQPRSPAAEPARARPEAPPAAERHAPAATPARAAPPAPQAQMPRAAPPPPAQPKAPAPPPQRAAPPAAAKAPAQQKPAGKGGPEDRHPPN